MTDIFREILNLSLGAAFVIPAVILVRGIFKKAPRRIMCILWLLVAVKLICPVNIESPFGLVPSAENVTNAIEQGFSAEDVPTVSGKPVSDTSNNTENITSSETPSAMSPVAPATNDKSFIGEADVYRILSAVWAAGAAVMILWCIFSTVGLRRRVADSFPLRDNIRLSERIASPFVMGFIRPKIYLPYGVSEESTERVLAHEYAHLRRGDHITKPLAFVLLAIHWFNPLVWAAYILFSRDIELACDEEVLRSIGYEKRRSYAAALLECGVERRRLAAYPIAFGEVGVKRRVRNAMTYKKPMKWIVAVSLAVVLVVSLCLFTVAEGNGNDIPKDPDAVVGGETTPDGNDPAAPTAPEGAVQDPSEYEDLAAYTNMLVGYIHEPYTAGESLANKRLLDLCFLYVLANPDRFDSAVNNTSESFMSVSEEELDELCRTLFGDDVSIRDYDRFLYMYPSDYLSAVDGINVYGNGEDTDLGCSATNLHGGTYTYTYATDYWGEDPFFIDIDAEPVITDNGERVTVTVPLSYSPELGTSESIGEAKYTFIPIMDDDGNTYYRLERVTGGAKYRQTVQCTPDNASINFNWGNEELIDGVPMFTMSVSDRLNSTEGDWKWFMKWDSDGGYYTRAFEYVNTFKVDSDFVMDGTIHSTAFHGGMTPTFEGVTAEIGVNKNGVEYVKYVAPDSRMTDGYDFFVSYIYLRVSDEYIVCFDYRDDIEHIDEVDRIIDSVTPMEWY